MKTEAGAHTASLGVGKGDAHIADGSVLFIISVPEKFYSAQGCAFACWCQGCPSFALLCSVVKEKRQASLLEKIIFEDEGDCLFGWQ